MRLGAVVPYAGRPGVSPATAVLIALDWIREDDHILDVGCGTGTEALLLAEWGCRHVEAVDFDPNAIRIARGRTTRRKLGKHVTFRRVDASELAKCFPKDTFDVVLHTLVANNLHEDEVEPHFAGIRSVMKPEGLLVVQERVHAAMENVAPGRLPPLKALRKHFDLTDAVLTHLPERAAVRRDPDYARVALWLGRPR